MSFFTPAALTPVPGSRAEFYLDAPEGCRFYLGHDTTSAFIQLAWGTRSDGASGLWRWLWRLLPPGTRRALVLPSLLHDELRRRPTYSKSVGDALFLEAMYATQVPALMREVAFLGTRLNYSRRAAR